MFVLVVLVAFIAIIAQGASEVVNSHAFDAVEAVEQAREQAIDTQNEIIGKVLNHFGVDGSKVSQESEPRSLRHTERELPSSSSSGSFYPYMSINSYYQALQYLDASGKPTCSTSGTPLMGFGFGMGCISMSTFIPAGTPLQPGMPLSIQMTCTPGDPGSISMNSVAWSGSNCDGSVINMPGIVPNQVMSCSATKMWQSCVGTTSTSPASLYNGMRTSTYLGSDVCMGSPLFYTDMYNSAMLSYTCDAGNIYAQVKVPNVNTPSKPIGSVSCNSTTPIPGPTNSAMTAAMSTGLGCISASSSAIVRTYQQWQMTQTINGVSADTWNSLANPDNIIAVISALADLYGINYEFISAIQFTGTAGSAAANLLYTIRVQPGFGNSYTTDNVYTSIVNIAKNSVAANCNTVISATNTNPCLASLIVAKATSSSLSGGVSPAIKTTPLSASFSGATSYEIVTTGAPPSGGGGGGSTSSNGSPSGGSNAGAIVGALLAVAVICGAVYYYKYVHLKAATDAAANATFDADAVKNPVSIGAPVAPAAPGAMPRK